MRTWLAAIVIVVYVAGYVGADFGRQFQTKVNTKHERILEKY